MQFQYHVTMQDRTIDNALTALWRIGGEQAAVAERLMILRDVPIPRFRRDRPLNKGGCRRIILGMLADGPVTSSQVADRLQELLGDIGRKSAVNRAYLCLLRLEGNGVVEREGRLWGIAIPKI